jgi:hypothetical protein
MTSIVQKNLNAPRKPSKRRPLPANLDNVRKNLSSEFVAIANKQQTWTEFAIMWLFDFMKLH